MNKFYLNVNDLFRSMEELKKHLQSYLTPESGLVGVVLSDREGVPLVSVTGEACPDAVTRTSFLSSFAGTSQEVGGKLGLGTNNTLVAVYGQYQVINWKCSMPESDTMSGCPSSTRGCHPDPGGRDRGQHRADDLPHRDDAAIPGGRVGGYIRTVM